MQEDYFIRQLKNVSKVLAIILGLSDKGKLEEAIEISEQALKSEFGLADDFSVEEIKIQLASDKLYLDDLKQLLAIVMLRANLFTEKNKDLASAEFSKALEIITLFQDKSMTFDFSILQKKAEILENLHKTNKL